MRDSRWVPVLAAVVTVVVLQAAVRDGFSTGKIVALVMLLLLVGFFAEQYLKNAPAVGAATAVTALPSAYGVVGVLGGHCRWRGPGGPVELRTG